MKQNEAKMKQNVVNYFPLGLFGFYFVSEPLIFFLRVFRFGADFIGALFPLRSMIMKQNEPKRSKMKTLHVRGFGEIWKNFDNFLEK